MKLRFDNRQKDYAYFVFEIDRSIITRGKTSSSSDGIGLNSYFDGRGLYEGSGSRVVKTLLTNILLSFLNINNQ